MATVLLVVCDDGGTAAWCARPIDLDGAGSPLVPRVLGPDRVPVVTDARQAARAPELAVLSALIHGAGPSGRGVLDALVGVFSTVEEQRGLLYYDVLFAALPQAARDYLEAVVSTGTYEYRSDFARKYISLGRAEGKAEGEASGEVRAVLAVLDARGIDVPDDARVRIAECRDLDQLGVWIRQAATAEGIEDLFA